MPIKSLANINEYIVLSSCVYVCMLLVPGVHGMPGKVLVQILRVTIYKLAGIYKKHFYCQYNFFFFFFGGGGKLEFLLQYCKLLYSVSICTVHSGFRLCY